MRVIVMNEAGYDEAMLGLSLSHNQPVENMPLVADGLVARGGSHAKFLESIAVWLDIRAPRYWWQEFDTYRVGVTKQSESTMHTVEKRLLTEGDFLPEVHFRTIQLVNALIEDGESLRVIKANLPEGFLQRREVCTNYKALAHMYGQRENHKLEEWRWFFAEILAKTQYPDYIRRHKER